MLRYIVLLIIGLMGFAQTATAQDTPCVLPTRLTVGIRAQVEPGPGSANNVRAEAGLQAEIIGTIAPGTRFMVLDGPVCTDSYTWWQITYGDITGWTAEGNPQQARYWLRPLTQPADPALLTGDERAYCQAPPDDYSIVTLDFAQLNARTVAMLDHATATYHAMGGLLSYDFRDALVQGSYNPGVVAASFGTHDGGGAVDISVRERGTWTLLSDDIPLMLRALRIAGFAAWLRDTDELYPGSAIHIHAIAVGDAALSEAARAQLDGTFGYFRGYNGLPQEDGIPLPDGYAPFVLCPWMEAIGFTDLRETS